MSFTFNPITGDLDRINRTASTSESSLMSFYSRFVCGKIVDIEEGFDNFIDCCSLPITSTRQTIDLGTLDEQCN